MVKKKILIGITGSIAAYKTVLLVREAVKAGYEVKVMLTSAAKEFVTPLTLQALSQNRVFSEQFDLDTELAMGHIELAKWADLILIAPCSASTIAKLAHGLATDLLSTVALAKPQATPLFIAPAMNKEMYHNPITQQNLSTLALAGVQILASDSGEQACGDVGQGRMMEVNYLLQVINDYFQKAPQGSNSFTVGFNACRSQLVEDQEKNHVIFPELEVGNLHNKPKYQITNYETSDQLASYLSPKDQEWFANFHGKHVLVTAGPTREMIDPVRYITNHSSGKMGIYLAALAQRMGAKVTLITGVVSVEIPPGIRTISVESAQQMDSAVQEALFDVDMFIGCAAVSDFRAKDISTQKIKKANGQDELTITLVRNPDILHNVCLSKNRPTYVVGFAAETNNVEEYARGKLISKGCDVICANDVSKENQGWNSDYNHVILYRKDGSSNDLGYDRKETVARKLMFDVAQQLYLAEKAQGKI